MVHRSIHTAILAAALSLLPSSPAWALFHFAHISELRAAGGTVQYVEIEMEVASQTFVADSILSAFACNGDFIGELLVVPTNLSSGGAGVRWVMASDTTVGGITADYAFAASDIDPTCGQVCWGAPGGTVPDPASWDHSDPTQYVDCVAYGGYTGITHEHAGTPTPLPPGDEDYALVRITDTDDNAADFVLDCPSPENNIGQEGDFGSCTSPITTTTTTTPGPGTTTTTTLPGEPTTDLIGATKLILRGKAGKPDKSAMLLIAKGAGITLGRGADTSDDPTRAGGRLLVAAGSADGAFVARYQLVSGNWTPKTKKGELVGYTFRGDGAVKAMKLIGGKLLKVKGKGSDLDHELDTDPSPVTVVLEVGEHALCFQLGGTTKFKADKFYRAKNAPAPSSSAACDAVR